MSCSEEFRTSSFFQSLEILHKSFFKENVCVVDSMASASLCRILTKFVKIYYMNFLDRTSSSYRYVFLNLSKRTFRPFKHKISSFLFLDTDPLTNLNPDPKHCKIENLYYYFILQTWTVEPS